MMMSVYFEREREEKEMRGFKEWGKFNQDDDLV